MRIRLAPAITLLLMTPGAWAQSPAAAPAPANPPMAGLSGNRNSNGLPVTRPHQFRKPVTQPEVAPRQRLSEMESTLSSMHAVLKQMQDKAASSTSKDSSAKANLQMWELMLVHLDKQLDQLRAATAAREDLEARRAALYNQAYDKAAKEAQAAGNAKPGQTPPAPSTVPPTPKE